MGWFIVLIAGVLATGGSAYLAGVVRGEGKNEQARGDLGEQLVGALGRLAWYEKRCQAQHNRIVAMTAWETMAWPDGRTSPPPVRPALTGYSDLSQPPSLAPRPRPGRERRTSTAAFLNPGEGAVIAGEPITAAEPIDYSQWQDGKPWHTPGGAGQAEDGTWWPEIEQQVAAAKIFLAGLP